jgi:POT family proton-dependent oligopeptide transporter
MSGANGTTAAFLGEQYTKKGGEITITRSGEYVVVDRDLTLESMYSYFYWGINVGGMSGLATTVLEKHYDFWAAFLLPACALSLSVVLLVFGNRHFSTTPVERTALPNALQAFWLASCDGFHMDTAKPNYQKNQHRRTITWAEDFFEELKLALVACSMLVLWSVLTLCRGQMGTNLISQAGQMESPGVPNDMMYNANQIVIKPCLPLVDSVLFPCLRRNGYALTAATRVALGFLFEAAAMAYAAGVQALI